MKISPKKSLGQNFLINAGILQKIVAVAELTSADTVLEIGPGTGNLTKLLSEKAGRVIAIEKDYRLIELLKTELLTNSKYTGNVEVIKEDILKFKPEEHGLKDDGYKIVANIPYYITSNLLRVIFESASWRMTSPKLIVLTIQKEVARRIVAKPPDMNLLALSVQLYSEPKIVSYVSRGSFRPIPKVDSAIIKLVPKTGQPENREIFFRLIKAGFSEKRKRLVNNLAKNFGVARDNLLKIFEKVGIESFARAENLSLNQWINLVREFK